MLTLGTEQQSAISAVSLIDDRISALVSRHAAALRRALPVSQGEWGELSLLVVGGLLLDLEVGDVLRRRDVLGSAPADWRLLAMPANWRLPSFGVVACWDERSGSGAGHVWYATGAQAYAPPPIHLSALFEGKEPADLTPADRVTLVHHGWLGRASRLLRIPENDTLWRETETAADDVLSAGYAALLAPLSPTARQVAHRLLLDAVLHKLIVSGAVNVAPPLRTQWLWQGRRYRIIEEYMRA